MRRICRYGIDFAVMMSIFGIILMYIIDYIIYEFFTVQSYLRWEAHHFHLIKDYLLQIILWIVLFWKCLRFRACKYTWTALISYGILILSWVCYYIFLFPYEIMKFIEISILLFGMLSMILTYTIMRWILSR